MVMFAIAQLSCIVMDDNNFLHVDLLTDRAGKVVEALSDRKVDVACIQETQRKSSACKFYGAKAKDISCSGWEVRRDRMV